MPIKRVVITPFQACTHSLIETVSPSTDLSVSAWGLLSDRGKIDWSKNLLVHTHVTLTKDQKFLAIQYEFMRMLMKCYRWNTVIYDPLKSMISSYTRGYSRGRYIVDQYVFLSKWLPSVHRSVWKPCELSHHENKGNRGQFHGAYDARAIDELKLLPDYDYLKSHEGDLKPYLCRHGLTNLPWYEGVK